MILNLATNYKSLPPFTIELPGFVILTGLNGAGKTQLLTAIADNALEVSENGVPLNSKRYLNSQSLAPNDSVTVYKEQFNSIIQNVWQPYQIFLQNKTIHGNTVAGAYGINQNYFKIVEKIAQNANKDITDLTADDFQIHFPIDHGIQEGDIFYQNFSTLFKRYYDKFEDNRYRRYRNEVFQDKEVAFLSDEKFFSFFGEPPWEFVETIISKAKLDYGINTPAGNNRDAPFELHLINKINGAQINFSALSSGEKVLMSLTLALYNANFDRLFPKILLMDEPDASLHPSMAKQFLDVVQNVFVNEKGVKVIFTTHSPSTIALAPEESIFIVNKTGQRIEKSSKDRALKILTTGVPSFSVNYENRRQVFVESQNDVAFYEKIYQRLSDRLIPEISLSFISSGESRSDKNGVQVSNCDQVINITELLRNSGNNFVWGIIDWDATNKTTDYIKVLGDGNRYSIENYLLDPILIGAFLLREKLVTREDLGLEKEVTFTDFKNLQSSQLQTIVDFITGTVATKIVSVHVDTEICELLNGLKVNIPKWYLHYQGHSLEKLLLEAYSGLNRIKRGREEALKLEIVEKIIDDIPEIISIDLLNILKSVQAI